MSSNAICAGTETARSEHSAALADDGGPRSIRTGARLVAMIDGACKN